MWVIEKAEVGRLVTRMWEKDYKEWKMFFHIMYMRQACVRRNYLRLWFSMRVAVDWYFLSLLFPKLTLMRPNLHKQTFGDLCHLACGCQLQQPFFDSWVSSFSWPPFTDWRHYVMGFPPHKHFVYSHKFLDLNLTSWPRAWETMS